MSVENKNFLLQGCNAEVESSHIEVGAGRQVSGSQTSGEDCGRSLKDEFAKEIEAVYGINFRGIYAYCSCRLYSRSLAEDATSAVFLKLVEKWQSLLGRTQAEIRNWLYGTASNVAAGLLRDAKHRSEVLANIAHERDAFLAKDPSEERRLDWPLLYQAIADLSKRDQELIVLHYFLNFDASAIADILDMKPGTVRVKLSRAVKRLQKIYVKNVD